MGSLEFLLKSMTISFTKVCYTFTVKIMPQPRKTLIEV